MVRRSILSCLFVAYAALHASPVSAQSGAAQPAAEPKPAAEIYGFAMLDMGENAQQVDPNWYDVLRPSKLPASPDQFGEDGHFFSSVRQSRLGVKMTAPTSLGDLNTKFEFELFGVGTFAGETTFRLRDAWGELGHFGAGQTDSPFMDGSVFPNSIEYWGPNGMVYFKNVQFRYTPVKGGANELVVALERPGASGDAGVFANRIELQNVKGRFPLPDLSGHYRRSGGWGHAQIAGIVRDMRWDDVLADQFDLGGRATGWGINASSRLAVHKDGIDLEATYGKAIENYMNDAPIDVGVEPNVGNRVTPVLGEPLPVFAMLAFYDRTWNDKWTSSAGYSRLHITTSSGQLPSDFKTGQYALANLLYTPVSNVMAGGEFEWGRRDNNTDGFSSHDYRVQFSFKYSFSYKLGS